MDPTSLYRAKLATPAEARDRPEGAGGPCPFAGIRAPADGNGTLALDRGTGQGREAVREELRDVSWPARVRRRRRGGALAQKPTDFRQERPSLGYAEDVLARGAPEREEPSQQQGRRA
jgi:hypothetical protein